MPTTTTVVVDNAVVPPKLLSPRHAWLACAAYWALGALVGAGGGYFAYLAAWRLPRFAQARGGVAAAAAVYGLAMLAPPFAERRYSQAVTYGRRAVSWAARGAFALLNGLFETLWMVAAFDAGRALVRLCGGRGAGQPAWIVGEAALSGAPSPASGGALAAQYVVGWLCFSAFSGAVHALFWDPYVFPPHARADVPHSAHIRFVIGFAAMGSAWTLLYACYGDVCAYVAIHVLHNVASDTAVRVQPPWGGAREYARYFQALADAAAGLGSSSSVLIDGEKKGGPGGDVEEG